MRTSPAEREAILREELRRAREELRRHEQTIRELVAHVETITQAHETLLTEIEARK